MGISTLEIEIIKRQRGIEAGATLWRHSTADLWSIVDSVGAIVRKRNASKEELINAILAVTHPAQQPAIAAVKVDQARMF